MSREAALCLTSNRDWYDAVFKTHGLAGAEANGLWTCLGQVPPYYSDAVTLSPTATDQQYRGIEKLARQLGRPFSLKDSFSTLDLAPAGFRLLFTADWIWRDAAPRACVDVNSWSRIDRASDLVSWEAAWRINGSPTDKPMFLPALLDDSNVTIFAQWRDGRIIAGCVANRSAKTIGLSNFFTQELDPEPDFAGAVATLAGLSPSRPVVGYESGDLLGIAKKSGFRSVGPLRIWLSGSKIPKQIKPQSVTPQICSNSNR